MLSASGNLLKCHDEEVLYLQPLIPPKRFDILPPITGGCSEDILLFTQAPIPVCLDGTIIDISPILVTMYYCGYVGV